MQIPITGPSYELTSRNADVQRSINLYPSLIESGTGKAPAYLQSIPGLVLFADLGAYVRGMTVFRDRAFAVAGDRLYELFAGGNFTDRGFIEDDGRPVGLAYNRSQLVISTRNKTYRLNFADTTAVEIAATGSDTLAVLNGRVYRVRPGTDQFDWSAIDVATFASLDFATAERTPDFLVGVIEDHGDLMLFGTESVEVWNPTESADKPVTRNDGAQIDVGAASPHCIKKLDNTVYWLGQDKQGKGIVWKMNGYTPVRVSTQAIEEKLQKLESLADAIAYTYQQDGHSFYCLNVTGLNTTLCFDVSTGAWHERAEWDGEFRRHRATHHVAAFAKHIVGSSDGKLYVLDQLKNTNAGDVLIRDRVTPHTAKPGGGWQFFASFELDCTTGKGKPDGTAALVMMRYSDDDGNSWCNWKNASLGVVGQRMDRVIWRRLGRGRQGRVFEVRCTDDSPFTVSGAEVL